jgi:hypothetical protein
VRQPNGQQSDLNEENSRLEIVLNGDGDCLIQIADLYQKQGEDYTYRLKITLVKPDFRLTFTPDRVIAGQGARVPVTLTAQRFGGFDGEIRIQYAGTLPEGLQIDGENAIPKGANATILVFTLPADAKFSHRLFQIEGVAQIEGKEVLREAEAREEFVRDGAVQTRPTEIPVVSVAPPPDMTVSTGATEFTLSPGGSIEIPIKIARKMGFGAKVPLTILGLPPGLTITAAPVLEGNQSEGKVALRAEGNAPIGTFKILAVAISQIDDQRRSPYVSAFLTLNVKK